MLGTCSTTPNHFSHDRPHLRDIRWVANTSQGDAGPKQRPLSKRSAVHGSRNLFDGKICSVGEIGLANTERHPDEFFSDPSSWPLSETVIRQSNLSLFILQCNMLFNRDGGCCSTYENLHL
jgi:hypothetical protein